MTSSSDLIPFDQNFVINLTKEIQHKVELTEKRKCRVLKISTELDSAEVLKILAILKPKDYQQLFVFVIESENFNFSKSISKKNARKVRKIKNSLLEFSKSRPMILQMTSRVENITKFYYKEEDSVEFVFVHLKNNNFEDLQNLPTLISSLVSNRHESLSKISHDMLMNVQGTLLLRFVRTLKLPEDSLNLPSALIPECAEHYTKNQLLALLDAAFENFSHILNKEAQEFLTWSFHNDLNDPGKSILSVAAEHRNAELFDFLIENFSHLIQQLPHDHQIEISSAAFASNHIRILCDLIQYADFPFPRNFQITLVTDEILKKLAEERQKFHDAIEAKNLVDIEKYIDGNSNSKKIFGIDNKTALKKALDAKQFEVLFHLKSIGFEATEFRDYKEMLEGDDLKKAQQLSWQQRDKNVSGALQDEQKSIKLLVSKSRIHNIKIDKETEEIYRSQMNKWFTDINKTESGDKLINVASQCDDLKLIFNFESETVYNIDFKGISSIGTTYPAVKWILIGAKGWDSGRSQEIKGALAHELGHLVAMLVFENKEFPYYMKDIKRRDQHERVVKELNLWTSQEVQNNNENADVENIDVDDECDGIISSMYKCYKEEDWHAELIVRVPQILAQYDDKPEQAEYLKEKYEPLFEYHRLYVVPEMEKFNLKNRENLRNFNKVSGLLPELEELRIEMAKPKDFNTLNEMNEAIVIVTDAPRLLMVDFHQQNFGFGQDNCAFVASNDLPKYSNELKKLQDNNRNLKVFVDCSNGAAESFNKNLKNLIFVTKSKRISKISDQNQSVEKLEINYRKCSDVTTESLKKLMQNNIQFQNDKKHSLLDSLTGKISTENDLKVQRKIAAELDEVIDIELLNHLLENSKVLVNTEFYKNICNSKFFKYINQLRTFKSSKSRELLSQQQLIKSTKGQKFVLLSDIAGNGKSCALKSITIELIETFDGVWVTYVDMKVFIKAFLALKDNADFLKFMVDHVFKQYPKFEWKMFTKLYETGKVVVLFDGFDEIAPNYCQTAVNIIKSFESNGGNQMWIATRDYFEIDLQKQLDLDVAYKLDDFTKNDGIEMITKIWILNDFEVQNKVIESAVDLESHQNIESFRKFAQDLIIKLSNLWTKSIGFPQLYKMIAEVSNNEKNSALDLNRLKIYQKFIRMQIERWSHEKGELRKEASINVQAGSSSFLEVHQFAAMKSYFPKETDFCGLTFNKNEWPDEELIACGMMTKTGESFHFPHETFREFFAAEFVVNNLKKAGHPNVAKFIVEFLKFRKYEVIRMFINDALADENTSKTIYSNILSLKETINKEIIGDEMFFRNENLPEFLDFLINLIKFVDYGKVQKILKSNIFEIIKSAKNTEIIIKIQEFFIQFMSEIDLKKLLKESNYVILITESSQSVEVLIHFVTKINKKLGKADKFWREFFAEKERNINSILYASVKPNNIEILEFWWLKVENLFKPKKFSEILKQTFTNDNYFFRNVAKCESLDFHKSFWKLLLRTFESREDLKEFIVNKSYFYIDFTHPRASNSDITQYKFKILRENFSNIQIQYILLRQHTYEENLLYSAAMYSHAFKNYQFLWKFYQNSFDSSQKLFEIMSNIRNPGEYHLEINVSLLSSEIFEFIIAEAEKLASHGQMRKMLSWLSDKNQNLLQFAAEFNESEEFHESLWKVFRKYFEASEILTFVRQKNKNGKNFFELAAKNRNFEEILKVAKKMAMLESESIDINLKTAIDKSETTVNKSEIAVIKLESTVNRSKTYVNKSGTSAQKSESTVIDDPKTITSESKTTIDERGTTEKNQKTTVINLENTVNKSMTTVDKPENTAVNLETTETQPMTNFNKSMTTTVHLESNMDEDKTIVNMPQTSETDFETLENSNGIFNNFNDRIFTFNFIKDADQAIVMNGDSVNLEVLSAIDEMEVHKCVWEMLLNSFTDREDLKKLLIRHKFTHLLVTNSKQDIINFALGMIKENFSDVQAREILMSKNSYNNLIHNLIICRKDIKEFEEIWTILKGSCGMFTKKSFLIFNTNIHIFAEFIKETGIYDQNIFHIAANHSSSEIFKFLVIEMEKMEMQKEIKKLLKKSDFSRENLLHIAGKYNKTVSFHASLWKVIRKYLTNSEVADLITQFNISRFNCIHITIESGEIEVVKYLWNEVESSKTFKHELIDIMSHCEKYSENILFTCIKSENTEILEFFWQKAENLMEPKKFRELIKSIASDKENILNFTSYCKWHALKFNDTLWKLLLKTFDNREELQEIILILFHIDDERFMKFLMDCQHGIYRVEHLLKIIGANFSISQIQEILLIKYKKRRNILQTVLGYSKDIKIIKFLFEFYQNSFESNENFIDVISKVDEDDLNILTIAVKFSSSEIFDFLITKLENVASRDKIRKMLSCKLNILKQSAFYNNSLDLHKSLWKAIEKYFDHSEIIKHVKTCNQNLIAIAVYENTVEIAKFIWSKIKNYLNYYEQIEYLTLRESSLYEMSCRNYKNSEEMKPFVKELLKEYSLPIN